jgi:hypothetical protein
MANEDNLNRFTDDIPFDVIRTPEQNDEFMLGWAAARRNEKRDTTKSLSWVLGYDEALKTPEE